MLPHFVAARHVDGFNAPVPQLAMSVSTFNVRMCDAFAPQPALLSPVEAPSGPAMVC